MLWLVRKLKLIFLLGWLLLLCVFGLWFAHENNSPMHVTFAGFQLPELPSSLYLMSALAIGALLGAIISYLSAQTKLASRRRALKKADKEVSKLRSMQHLEERA